MQYPRQSGQPPYTQPGYQPQRATWLSATSIATTSATTAPFLPNRELSTSACAAESAASY